jgi:hypothetical protein
MLLSARHLSKNTILTPADDELKSQSGSPPVPVCAADVHSDSHQGTYIIPFISFLRIPETEPFVCVPTPSTRADAVLHSLLRTETMRATSPSHEGFQNCEDGQQF